MTSNTVGGEARLQGIEDSVVAYNCLELATQGLALNPLFSVNLVSQTSILDLHSLDNHHNFRLRLRHSEYRHSPDCLGHIRNISLDHHMDDHLLTS